MHSVTRLALALLLHTPLAIASPSGDEPLGTLFYTPAERAAIAAAREGKTSTGAGLTLTGVIKRKNGKGTLWLNRQAIPEGQAIPPAPAPSITTQGITIEGKPVRVGETVNLVTGERTDFIPQGAVSARKVK